MRRLGIWLALAFWAPVAIAQLAPPFVPGLFDNTAAGLVPSSGCGTCISTPISLTSTANSAPATAAINYSSFNAGSVTSNYNATIANVAHPVATAGTLSGLYVNIGSGFTAGSYSLCVTIGTASTPSSTCSALQCNVTSSGSGASCSDTSDNAAVTVGQLIALKWCPYNTAGCTAGTAPTIANTNIQVGLLFVSTVGQEAPLWGGNVNNNMGTGAQNWAPIGTMGSWAASSDVTISNIMPAAGTIDNLYVYMNGSPGGSNSYAFTVYKNGSAGSVTCTVSAAATTCNDLFGTTTDRITFARGDTISISETPTGPPTARQARVGVRWIPTTTNQVPLMATSTTNPPTTTSVTRYNNISGNPGQSTTEAPEYSLSSVLGTHMTLSNLIVGESAAPTSTNTRTNALFGSTPGTPLSATAIAQVTNVAAAGTWTTASTTITVASCPAGIAANQSVYDTTTTPRVIGTVASCSVVTLTLNATATYASVGATDALVFGAPVCTISASSTAVFQGGTTPGCENTKDSWQPQTGNFLDYHLINNGTQTAVTWYKTGMVVTVP